MLPSIALDREVAAVVLRQLVDDEIGAQPLGGDVAGRGDEDRRRWGISRSIGGFIGPSLPAIVVARKAQSQYGLWRYCHSRLDLWVRRVPVLADLPKFG